MAVLKQVPFVGSFCLVSLPMLPSSSHTRLISISKCAFFASSSAVFACDSGSKFRLSTSQRQGVTLSAHKTRSESTSQMCMFDKRQFDYNRLLFTWFLLSGTVLYATLNLVFLIYCLNYFFFRHICCRLVLVTIDDRFLGDSIFIKKTCALMAQDLKICSDYSASC